MFYNYAVTCRVISPTSRFIIDHKSNYIDDVELCNIEIDLDYVIELLPISS